MIADNIMEFRFAVAREYKMGSDYHDKVGVFIDEEATELLSMVPLTTQSRVP